jgi:hypothetical protein
MEEAVEVLAAKVKTKSFRKAVGARAAEAVETLLNAYRCGACLTEREAAWSYLTITTSSRLGSDGFSSSTTRSPAGPCGRS